MLHLSNIGSKCHSVAAGRISRCTQYLCTKCGIHSSSSLLVVTIEQFAPCHKQFNSYCYQTRKLNAWNGNLSKSVIFFKGLSLHKISGLYTNPLNTHWVPQYLSREYATFRCPQHSSIWNYAFPVLFLCIFQPLIKIQQRNKEYYEGFWAQWLLLQSHYFYVHLVQ
jgi:hypothetical protein